MSAALCCISGSVESYSEVITPDEDELQSQSVNQMFAAVRLFVSEGKLHVFIDITPKGVVVFVCSVSV